MQIIIKRTDNKYVFIKDEKMKLDKLDVNILKTYTDFKDEKEKIIK